MHFNIIKSYQMRLSTKFIFTLDIAVQFIGIIFCALYIINPEFSNNWMKFILFLLLLFGIFSIPEFIVGLIKTRLYLMDKGLLFRRAFYEMYCEWNSIQSITVEQDSLEMIANKEIIITRLGYFGYSMWHKNVIPLHYFIRKWHKKVDWETCPILSEIMKHRPDLTQFVISKSKGAWH